MKNSVFVLFTFFLIILSESLYTQQWTKYFGGNLDDKAYAITVDKDNFIYVTGYVSTSNKGTDFRTIKVKPVSGSVVWTRDYDGPAHQDDKAYTITVDSLNNIYVAGYSTGIGTGTDMTVIKYNSGGSQLWVRSYNSTTNGDDEALAIAVDKFLNVYITGFVTMVNTDIHTIKFNSAGTPQWHRFLQGTAIENDKAYAIGIDLANNIYVGGYTTNTETGADFTLIKYKPGGTQQWVAYYDGPAHSDDIAVCMALSRENCIYLSGSSKSNGAAGSEDYMTVRFNPLNGEKIWTRRHAGPGEGEDKVYAIIVDKLDNIFVTGSVTSQNIAGNYHSKNFDYLTIKYNPEGDTLWTAVFDTSSRNDIAVALTVSNSGNYLFVTGSTKKGNNPDSQDVATIKYNALTGDQLQASVINGPGNGEDNVNGIFADSSDNIFLAGYMKTVNSGIDWFIARYPKGDLIAVENISSSVPNNFALYQNYPNPFNPVTTIKFDVFLSGHVKLVVYDVLGNQVEILVNEYLRSGTYEVSYSASLSSGVYFYELTAGNFRDVRKMVLIK